MQKNLFGFAIEINESSLKRYFKMKMRKSMAYFCSVSFPFRDDWGDSSGFCDHSEVGHPSIPANKPLSGRLSRR